jgi:MYXO-CTERM domain-containing protein
MRRGRNRVAAVVMTAAFVASGLAAAVPAVAAPAAPKGTEVITAVPAPGSQLAPRDGYYLLHARPGAAVTQTVHLTNNNPDAVDVRVAGLDGFTSAATGTTFTAPSRTASKAGTWIVVSTAELRMQPAEQRDVNFTVHVPPNAKPGEYLAGIGMWIPLAAPQTTAPSGNHAGFSITLQGERVIAVEVVVPGPKSAKLEVDGVKPVVTSGAVGLQIAIANSGNALTRGSGVVTVEDTKLDYPFKINTFVSHTAIGYQVPWTKSIVAGDHAVSVRLTYDGRVTTWNGTVSVTGAVKAGLEHALRESTVGVPVRVHSSSSASSLFVVGLAAAAALVVGAVVLRRRRRKTPALAG